MRKVHVRDETGLPRYNNLIDEGSDIMLFHGKKHGKGFILKCKLPKGFTIEPGWFEVSSTGFCDWATIDKNTLGEY